MSRCTRFPQFPYFTGSGKAHRFLTAATLLTSVASLLPVLSGCTLAADTSDRGGPGSPGQEEATAFVGVTVLPMDRERVLEDQTVIVRGQRIAEIGPADKVGIPTGARRVDARGQVLIPGLGEMHAHVPPQGGRDFMKRVLFLYLSNGITTVRGMLGEPAHLELKEEVARGDLLGPRIYTSGPSLNGNSIPDPDSARRAVLYQTKVGYDFLKIHPGLSRASYDAIAHTADSVGIRWAGHVPADVGLWRALEAGQATVDHLDQYMEALVPEGAETTGLPPLFFGVQLVDLVDESKIAEVAEATREAGVWNVPTQSLIEHILDPDQSPEMLAAQPEMRYMPPEMVSRWIQFKTRMMQSPTYTPERARRFIEIRRHMIKGLSDAGAKLLLGSDAPQVFQVPGFSIQTELELAVAAGLSPYEALVAGTRNIAEYFDAQEEYGTVEEGKVADLVLLEGNPLEDITNTSRIAGVMARGRWLSAGEIRERLTAYATGATPQEE